MVKGQNALDDNEPMDIAGRIVVSPISELNLGVAHYNGKSGSNEEENIRTGIEAKFTIEPLSVYGEYATGKTVAKKRNTYYIILRWSNIMSLIKSELPISFIKKKNQEGKSNG